MKTSSIGYRVADFLRRHPPFQYMDDDELIDLVRGGRVQFHEDGEIVFEQGRKRKPFVYVVQQGVVRLVQETPDGEVLRDVRGEGDLLGIGRFVGNPDHYYTARTETDVILYALPAEPFADLVKRHPRAARFLAAYFTIAESPPGLEGQEGRSEELRLGRRPVDWMGRAVAEPRGRVVCGPDEAVRDVAARMARAGVSAAAVTDAQGLPLGLITPTLLSEQVATGIRSPDAPAGSVMMPCPPVECQDLEAGAYLIRMLEADTEHVVLTEDGSVRSPVVRLVSRRDLTRVEGAAPLAIVEDIARARGTLDLKRVRAQGDVVLGSGLSESGQLRWLAPTAGAFNAAVLRRLVYLVQGALEEEGVPNPGLRHCWVFFGSAGRNELLTHHDLDHGLIYEDSPASDERIARSYFLELGRRVSAGLSACGFVTTEKGIMTGHPSGCRSVTEWQRAFGFWVGDPVECCVYRATSFFDLRPIAGDCALAEELGRFIHAREADNPVFVPLLVNDSMANLPPLTFFRGLVVDDEGAYEDMLDLQRATLQPVVDIARALALDSGISRETSTLARLRATRLDADGDERLIEGAIEAFRNALYHRARTGLTTGSDGRLVDPVKLTRLEQNLLKAGFRTVLQLMEYVARRYGLSPRK